MSKSNLKVNLPKSWPAVVRSAMLHIVSLAQYAAIYSRSWAANSTNARVRLRAENDRDLQEVAMLREELRIKDARMAAQSSPAAPKAGAPLPAARFRRDVERKSRSPGMRILSGLNASRL